MTLNLYSGRRKVACWAFPELAYQAGPDYWNRLSEALRGWIGQVPCPMVTLESGNLVRIVRIG
jgi:hypothetical protein